MLAAAEENPAIPLAMHLDHGNSLDTVKKAIDLGFTSVMIDGSLDESGKVPNTYEQNLEITRKCSEYAHQTGVTVEAELGTLGGIEDGHGADQIHLTDPKQVEAFVKATKVDALAIAIGTSHGAYKFKAEPKLAFDIIEEVRRLLPGFPLVMHGSSSVPKELVDRVNKYGGKMPNACGVPIESIQKAIKLGVQKINVDTDGRMAVTAAIRKVFMETPEKFDPRDYLGPARDDLKKLIVSKMKDFGTAGHAKDYGVKTLQDYIGYYKNMK